MIYAAKYKFHTNSGTDFVWIEHRNSDLQVHKALLEEWKEQSKHNITEEIIANENIQN